MADNPSDEIGQTEDNAIQVEKTDISTQPMEDISLSIINNIVSQPEQPDQITPDQPDQIIPEQTDKIKPDQPEQIIHIPSDHIENTAQIIINTIFDNDQEDKRDITPEIEAPTKSNEEEEYNENVEIQIPNSLEPNETNNTEINANENISSENNNTEDNANENNDTNDNNNNDEYSDNSGENDTFNQSYQIHADYSTKPGEISIDNYDKNKKTKFTDHGTIAALEELGIDSCELFMPKENDVKKYDPEFLEDPDFRGVFLNHHEERINRLVKIISRERRKILDFEANSELNNIEIGNDTNITTNNTTNEIQKKRAKSQMVSSRNQMTGMMAIETKKLEKLQNRQKREVEAMINQVFEIDKIHRDMQDAEIKEQERLKQKEKERKQKSDEAHQKHMQRLKELEKLEMQKLKDEESKRKLQYEKDKKENEHQQKLI